MKLLIPFLLFGLVLLLGGCAAAMAVESSAFVPLDHDTEPASSPTPIRAALPDLGAAPELTNEVWINSDEPLTLEGERGRVVLLEFWTFGCINCQRTVPWIKSWHERFTGDDFSVISIHYPEFAHERELENVREATLEQEIAYPVALDNDGVAWRAYSQRFWPVTYLIDKNGRIRYKHIGEFNARSAGEAEIAIQSLIAEPAN